MTDEAKWPLWKTALLLLVAAPLAWVLAWALAAGLLVFFIWIF